MNLLVFLVTFAGPSAGFPAFILLGCSGNRMVEPTWSDRGGGVGKPAKLSPPLQCNITKQKCPPPLIA
ncbi:MAG TPA: hypothetical protein VK165_04350 [Azonexus sp.]|nr:hypothetical protein [Azonexus sp.]